MNIIYTAIFGDYDTLFEPEVITPNVKYICFTDKPIQSKVWQIIHVDAKYDACRQARHVKIMFHEYIKEFDTAIWIDANQQLKADMSVYFTFKFPLVVLSHPERNCIYEEAKECIKLKKDDKTIIDYQIDGYEASMYPKDNGLVATGLMIRRNESNVNILCKMWFNEVLLKSRRDQLSFNYVYYTLPSKLKPRMAQLPFETLYEIATRWKHIK